MKQFFTAILFIPVLATAQKGKSPAKPKIRTTVTKTATAATGVQPAGGYLIKGNISGVEDGAVMKMLNGSTGVEEQSATVKGGKFSFAGTLTAPDFKFFGVNGQPPYLIVYLDNSVMTINGTKDAFADADVKGSKSEDDFKEFTAVTKPYSDLLEGKGRFDVEYMNKAALVLEKFVVNHKASFVSPLAIYRYNAITGDYAKLESLYNELDVSVKTTQIGNYLANLVTENKKAGYGSPVTDFTQADTSGKNVSLSSFRGKYVLLDFWASWCGPCRAENPNVVNAFTKYKEKNFTVLSVSLDRAKQSWIDAIQMDHLDWTHVSDLQFWSNAVAQQFGISQIPQNMLLDPQGNLIGKNLRGAALDYKLSQVLK